MVTEATEWEGGLASISSFGFGGTNVHLVMESLKKQQHEQEVSKDAQLLVCSSRTKEGAEAILKKAVEVQDNSAALSLLHDSFANLSPSSHPFRGSTILNCTSHLASATVEVRRFLYFNNSYF